MTQAVGHEKDASGIVFRQFADPLETFLLEAYVADGEHFVEEKDIGIKVGRDRKGQPHAHAA
jgi:hypothetical protein